MDLVEIKQPSRRLSKFFMDQHAWEKIFNPVTQKIGRNQGSGTQTSTAKAQTTQGSSSNSPTSTTSTISSASSASSSSATSTTSMGLNSSALKQFESAQESLRLFRHLDWNETLLEPYKTHMNLYELFLDWIEFESWPQGLRWGLESLAIVSIVVVISMVIPWNRISTWKTWISSDQVVLNETSRSQNTFKEDAEGEEVTSGPEDGVGVLYPDEPERKEDTSKDLLAVPSPKAKELLQPATPSNTRTAGELAKSQAAVTSSALAPAPATAPTATPALTLVQKQKSQESLPQEKEEGSAKSASSQETAAAKRSGFLYRAQFKVTNLEVVTAKSIEAIGDLGGRKAGQVPLGWRKGSGSYFHFTMPETKISALKDFLSQFGELNLEKEKHERAMPEGIARIIIQMEEK